MIMFLLFLSMIALNMVKILFFEFMYCMLLVLVAFRVIMRGCIFVS